MTPLEVYPRCGVRAEFRSDDDRWEIRLLGRHENEPALSIVGEWDDLVAMVADQIEQRLYEVLAHVAGNNRMDRREWYLQQFVAGVNMCFARAAVADAERAQKRGGAS